MALRFADHPYGQDKAAFFAGVIEGVMVIVATSRQHHPPARLRPFFPHLGVPIDLDSRECGA
jgi:hypothetical protein